MAGGHICRGPSGLHSCAMAPTLVNYVERDGIWHLVVRTEDAEAVTVCSLRIVQQTYLWERQPSPLCSRCKTG